MQCNRWLSSREIISMWCKKILRKPMKMCNKPMFNWQRLNKTSLNIFPLWAKLTDQLRVCFGELSPGPSGNSSTFSSTNDLTLVYVIIFSYILIDICYNTGWIYKYFYGVTSASFFIKYCRQDLKPRSQLKSLSMQNLPLRG